MSILSNVFGAKDDGAGGTDGSDEDLSVEALGLNQSGDDASTDPTDNGGGESGDLIGYDLEPTPPVYDCETGPM